MLVYLMSQCSFISDVRFSYCSAYKVKVFWMIWVSKYGRVKSEKIEKIKVLHSDKLMSIRRSRAAGT